MKRIVLALNVALSLTLLLLASPGFADQARLLFTDDDAIQARVDIIQQAKSEILVEYFSVWNDAQSVGGIALLVEAAKRGVKVKVVLDALSTKIPEPLMAALEENSVGPDGTRNLELKFYNPISLNLTKVTHRDHSKMIIVDGKLLLTGGRNVGDKYFGVSLKRNYDDLDILVSGKVVLEARKNFLQVWDSKVSKFPGLTSLFRKQLHPLACMGEEEYDSCAIRQRQAFAEVKEQEQRMSFLLAEILKIDGDDLVQPHTQKDWMSGAPEVGNIRFMLHKPDELVRPETAFLTHELMKELRKVKKEAFIIAPYLIPTVEVLEVFKSLVRRGVRIRIVTNSLASNDIILAQAGYYYRKAALIRAGVEIYEYKGPSSLHAKTAVFDGSKLFVGTYNLDPRSAFINREVALMMTTEGPLAGELLSILNSYQENAVLVAKEGKEHNLEWQKNSVSASKRARMTSLLPLTPFIIHQL